MQVFRGDQDWICNKKCLKLNSLLQKSRRLRKNFFKTLVDKSRFCPGNQWKRIFMRIRIGEIQNININKAFQRF